MVSLIKDFNMMRQLFFSLFLLLGTVIQCFAQVSNDTVSIQKVETEVNVSDSINRAKVDFVKSELYKAGSNLKFSSCIGYVSMATGAASVILICRDLSKKGDDRKVQPVSYLLAGATAAFALASITFKCRAGRSLKLVAGADGATAIFKF